MKGYTTFFILHGLSNTEEEFDAQAPSSHTTEHYINGSDSQSYDLQSISHLKLAVVSDGVQFESVASKTLHTSGPNEDYK